MANFYSSKFISFGEKLKNNFRKKPLITVGMILISLVLLSFIITRTSAIASRGDNDINNLDLSKAIKVSAISVKEVSHYSITQNISGQITAARISDHGFDRGGILEHVYVDEGDKVKKGDILAKLDMRKLEAKGQELKADLNGAIAVESEAAANLTRSQAAYDRYDILMSNGHISQHKFDQVKFDLQSVKAKQVAAKASIDKVEAALSSLNADRELSTLKAHFDGNVIARYMDEGSSFGIGGKPIIRLQESGKLEIHVGLPEKTASKLKIGNHYQFNQLGKKIDTRLRSILSEVDLNTRTVTAIFDIQDAQNIRAGSIAQLSIVIDIMEKGFWLPTDALGESRRGLWSAYSLTPVPGHKEISKLARHDLQVIYTGVDRVFVRGTLNDGDIVVASGIHRLAPGFLVTTKSKD